MGSIASQIPSLAIVYSIVYSSADQRKHQSSASLAFVRGIHRGPVNSPHKWPVTRKMFPFDDVIMLHDTIGGHWDYCPGTLFINQVISRNVTIGTKSSIELQWVENNARGKSSSHRMINRDPFYSMDQLVEIIKTIKFSVWWNQSSSTEFQRCTHRSWGMD